jgi:phenylacetate-CoA ligase
MAQPLYFDTVDCKALAQEYPLGDVFVERFKRMSRDELFALQDGQFKRCMARGWQIPFYQRLWGAKGIEAGDIRGLDDITKLPTFSKTELMESVERAPPLGDYHGLESFDAATRPSMVLHTTSGTTGRPQPLLRTRGAEFTARPGVRISRHWRRGPRAFCLRPRLD